MALRRGDGRAGDGGGAFHDEDVLIDSGVRAEEVFRLEVAPFPARILHERPRDPTPEPVLKKKTTRRRRRRG
jgi:hypothetical protein